MDGTRRERRWLSARSRRHACDVRQRREGKRGQWDAPYDITAARDLPGGRATRSVPKMDDEALVIRWEKRRSTFLAF